MKKRFPWVKGMFITSLLFTSVGCMNQAGTNHHKLTPQNHPPTGVSYDKPHPTHDMRKVNRPKSGKPVIYYCPHQDDETLSYSVDILNQLAAGRQVIVVLYINSSNPEEQKLISEERKLINGESYSLFWRGTHNPSKEGYTPLTDEQFKQTRMNEFRCACYQLGVEPADIILDLPQRVDVTGLKKLISKYEMMYPGASHKAMSYHDEFRAHAVSGEALNMLYNEGIVANASFFISRYNWQKPNPGVIFTATADQVETIKHAAEPYHAWNPPAGAYAYGFHSVPGQFKEYLAHPQNKIHKPNE
jgi:LmbE family N-acetylglucosaminyl deacetylase